MSICKILGDATRVDQGVKAGRGIASCSSNDARDGASGAGPQLAAIQCGILFQSAVCGSCELSKKKKPP